VVVVFEQVGEGLALVLEGVESVVEFAFVVGDRLYDFFVFLLRTSVRTYISFSRSPNNFLAVIIISYVGFQEIEGSVLVKVNGLMVLEY
jgi:hypothetical protein